MPVTIRKVEEEQAASLAADLLSAQSVVEMPEAATVQEALAIAQEALREMALLKQQLAGMGIDPVAATQGATPAVNAASAVLDAAIQKGDEMRLREAWAAEPHTSVWLEPDDMDKAVLAARLGRWNVGGQQGPRPSFPARRFQVNGVVMWIEVGKTAQVPESIAALIDNTRSPALHMLNITPAGEQQFGYWVGDQNPFGVN